MNKVYLIIQRQGTYTIYWHIICINYSYHFNKGETDAQL